MTKTYKNTKRYNIGTALPKACCLLIMAGILSGIWAASHSAQYYNFQNGDKVISADGYSITLTNSFEDSGADIGSMSFLVNSKRLGVTCSMMKEAKQNFTDAGGEVPTLREYAKLFNKSNHYTDDLDIEKIDDKNIYFTFVTEENATEMFMCIYITETTDDFYITQFICGNSDKKKYKARFTEWAATIRTE